MADHRVELAKDLIVRYGGVDGEHHKTWVIDQVFRALCGSVSGEETQEYRDTVTAVVDGGWSWEVGIAP